MIIAAKAATSGQGELSYTWVAAGASGALSTSTSSLADSWTSQTSSFGASQIWCVAANKTSTWVAVGADGKLATSTDATTWTQRTSSFSTSIIYTVAFGDGIWVAAGADGKLATATDPTGTWTQRTTGFAGASIIFGVTFGNGIWCAINSTGEIRTATDPTGTWTLRTSTLSTNMIKPGRYPVKWMSGQSIFVAGIDATVATGALASSPDGITWTARNSPNTTAAVGPWCSFASSSTVGVMAYRTTNTDVASTTNGTTWTDRTPAVTTNRDTGSVAVDESGLFVLSTTNTIQTTTDGTTWTSRTAPTITDMTIAHSSGG